MFIEVLILLTASLAQAETALRDHVLINPPPSNALYSSNTYIVGAPILLVLVMSVFVTVLSLTIVRRRKVEEALRKSEQKFRALFDNVQDTVFIHDLEGHILDANRTACLRLGYSHDEFLRMTPTDVDVPEMAIKVSERFEMLQKKDHTLFETIHRQRDGSAYPVEVSSMLFEHGGKMLVCSFCRDITERKRTEEKVRESEVRFRSLVQNSNDVILILDAEATIHFISPAIERIAGYPSSELEGTVAFSHIHPDDAVRIRQLFTANVKKPGTTLRVEYRYRHKNGDWLNFEANAANLFQNTQFLGMLVNIRDMTERKQAEDLVRARHRFSMRLASVSSLDESLSSCFDMILSISGMDCGGVYRVSPKTGDFELLASKGLSESFVAEVAHLPADSLQVRTVLTTKPLYSTFAALGIPSEIQQKEALRAIAIVPIIHQGKIIACYNIASHNLDFIPKNVQELLEAVVLELGNAITRILAEEALKEKIEELDRYFTNSLDLLCIVDTTGHFIRLNPEWEKVLGFSLSGLEGRRFFDLVHPDDQEATIKVAESLMSQKEVLRFANRYLCKDGTYRWIEWNSHPVGGQIYAVARDITERKRAEEALLKSEARYRAIIESQVDLISRYLPNTTLTFVNDAYCKFYGKTREELIGHSYLFMIAPEFREVVRKETEYLALNHKSTVGEFLNYRHDGQERWIQWAVQCITDEHGQVVELQAVGRDITERKQAEEALRESEKRFSAVVRQARDGIILIQDNLIIFANQALADTLGYTPEAMERTPFVNYIAPESRAMVAERVAARLRGEKPSSVYEAKLLRKDGRIIETELSAGIIQHRGKPTDVGLVRDITERKRAEEELARHRDRLEELVKERTAELEKEISERKQAEEKIRATLAEKEVLLREVHHRVKNNLNTIANILYFQAKTVEDKKALAAFQDSQNRIHSMARVHEHLYRSSSLAQINMDAYFKDLAADMQQPSETGPVAIRINATREHLDIDRAIPCGLIVNELVTNSLKYAFPQGITNLRKEVTVQLTTQADQHILEVHDNGVGLPAGLDAEKSSSLGLRLVSMLTRQLKGRLAVDTQAGQGTKFTLTFPIETTGGANGKN